MLCMYIFLVGCLYVRLLRPGILSPKSALSLAVFSDRVIFLKTTRSICVYSRLQPCTVEIFLYSSSITTQCFNISVFRSICARDLGLLEVNFMTLVLIFGDLAFQCSLPNCPLGQSARVWQSTTGLLMYNTHSTLYILYRLTNLSVTLSVSQSVSYACYVAMCLRKYDMVIGCDEVFVSYSTYA